MSRRCVIFNPSAKSDKAGGLEEELRGLAEGEAEMWATEARGDATRLGRRAAEEGFDVAVAAGGDGTINEVVNGLAGSDVALGILPVGTINVFAQELGLPLDHGRAWEVVRAGRTRWIDLPQAGGHAFVQLAGIGMDAQVVRETAPEMKRALGPLSYLIKAGEVLTRKPPKLVVRCEDGTEVRGAFVLVGNGRYYGGPFHLFPEAQLDDGSLHVCVFRKMNWFDALRYIQGVLFREHDQFHDVEMLRGRSFRVESDEGEIPVEADGELAGWLPMEFSIRPGGLRVIVPG